MVIVHKLGGSSGTLHLELALSVGGSSGTLHLD